MKLPEKHLSITSLRNTAEIISLLKSRLCISGHHAEYVFEGKVHADGSFTLQQFFDYGPRNTIRPVIKGLVKPDRTGSIVEITFGIPHEMAVLMVAVVLINTVVAVILLWRHLFMFGFGLIGAMICFIIVSYGMLTSKIENCSRVLRSIIPDPFK